MISICFGCRSYWWRWCCHWSTGGADLLHTWRSETRSPEDHRYSHTSVCSAPSSGPCSAAQPIGRCMDHFVDAGGPRRRSDSPPTPPAPPPRRWGDRAAVGRRDEPPGVWEEQTDRDGSRWEDQSQSTQLIHLRQNGEFNFPPRNLIIPAGKLFKIKANSVMGWAL